MFNGVVLDSAVLCTVGSSRVELFNVSNGVRQGGLISPRLFNIYIDALNVRLIDSGVGCNIGGIFINNLSYADDMVLISPSVKGLRSLVSICEIFATEHDITYNTKKTECMYLRPPMSSFSINPIVYLCGKRLAFVKQFKYLGHLITDNLFDDLDIKRQYRSLCIRANMLRRNFYMCSHETKLTLFKSYCMSLYTAELWCRFTKTEMTKLTVCYNNSLRWFLRYPKYCSASAMFVSNEVKSFPEVQRSIIYSFICRLNNSQNILLQHITNCDLRWCSPLWRVWTKALYTQLDNG